jgi:hypothetical protein
MECIIIIFTEKISETPKLPPLVTGGMIHGALETLLAMRSAVDSRLAGSSTPSRLLGCSSALFSSFFFGRKTRKTFF